MDNRPIGVFDSGRGGLTVIKEMIDILPNQSIVYLGDTKRLPYGTKNRATILKYAEQDIKFLQTKNIKMIISACGTISSNVSERSYNSLNMPYTGIIKPSAMAATQATSTGKIGVIGTDATVKSKAFEKEILNINKNICVTSIACPLFVSFVEDGLIDDGNETALLTAKYYLKPFCENGCDVLILGCTHFPLLKNVIAKVLPSNVMLINAGKQTARYAKSILTEQNLLPSQNHTATYDFYVSADVNNFINGASLYLGDNLPIENSTFSAVSL